MPAPPLSNNFDGGVSGNNIATAATGSGDQWSLVSGTTPAPQYSNAQKHSGTNSMVVVEPVTSAAAYVQWNTLGTLTGSVYFRCYVYLTALPNVNVKVMFASTAANTSSAGLFILTTGVVRATNAAAGTISTGVKVIPLNEWVRLEWRVKSSATVGESEWKMFSSLGPGDGGDGSTPTERINSAATQVLGADTDRIAYGVTGVAFTSQTMYFDDPAVATSGFLGSSIIAPYTAVKPLLPMLQLFLPMQGWLPIGFPNVAIDATAGLTAVSTTALLPLEWQNLATATGLDPLEWTQGGIASARLVPLELAQGAIAQTSAEPVEWSGYVGNTGLTPVEWVNLAAASGLTPLESLAAATQASLEPLEWLQAVAATGLDPVEWAGAVASALLLPLEWSGLTTVTATGLLPLEWQAAAAATGSVPLELLAAAAKTSLEPLEWLNAAATTAANPLEWQANAATPLLLPIEWSGLAAVTQTALLPLEWQAAAASPLTSSVQWTSPVATGLLEPVEWQQGALAAIVVPVEILKGVSQAAILLVNASGNVVAAAPLPIEWAAVAAAFVAAMVTVQEATTVTVTAANAPSGPNVQVATADGVAAATASGSGADVTTTTPSGPNVTVSDPAH